MCISDWRSDVCSSDLVAPLDTAGPDDVSFLDNRRYVGQFGASKAGACIVSPELAEREPPGMALLLTRRPYRGSAKVTQAIYPAPRPVGRATRRAQMGQNSEIADVYDTSTKKNK